MAARISEIFLYKESGILAVGRGVGWGVARVSVFFFFFFKRIQV